MIVFIPCSGEGCKPREYDAEWLPRFCPACWLETVIGHGRRWRQAHDESHGWIRVRRGMCNACGVTLTVLPWWCVPGAHYSLLARLEALDRLRQGMSMEEAAPACQDPNRLPEPSTIRRWLRRRMESFWLFLGTPTLLAWDWLAASRILIAESLSP